jgi:hypothetical protein
MRARIFAGALVALFATSTLVDAQRRPGRESYNRYFGGGEGEYWSPPDFAGNVPYDGRFTFARIKYRGFDRFSGREGPGWSHDYPHAESNLTRILRDITALKPFIESGPMVGSVIVALDDPLLFKYPVAYMSEPGGWHPNDKEIAGVRAYLLKGGFMMFDDFREAGSGDFTNLQREMSRALPGAKWVQLTGKEPIFDSFLRSTSS